MSNNKKTNCIIVIIIILSILGITLIKYGLQSGNTIIPIYSYTAQKTDNYNVLLKPNTFYETETLPAGGYYASKSIYTYNINLMYDFKSSQKANIEYNYTITANLVGTAIDNDNKNKEVWNRTFIIKDNTNSIQENIDSFSINEPVNIDYDYYNNVARSYEKAYGITINAILKIRFNISYSISADVLGSDVENVEDYIELDIPITSTISEVQKNYENVTSKDITLPMENTRLPQKTSLAIGISLIIVALVTMMITINKKMKSPEIMYNHKLKHIFKYYRDLIVTVSDKPTFSSLQIMNVSIIDDLIDVAEQTQNNIIYYKTPNKKQSNFYVIVDNYVYVYTLSVK